MSNYEAVIGLEIHAELKTRTKMFCVCLNDPDEKHPNVNICPICMGHPGTLPNPNKEAIALTQRVGAALGCALARTSKFDRKSYFYPDLPKGYQISQFDMPFCGKGALKLQNGKTIGITRIHLEEDSARSAHPEGKDYSSIDFNRAGRPLMELVTEPELRTAEDVELFAQELQRILRYVGASDANMEKGEMRVEVNLSLRPEPSAEMGTKVEVKNLNSVRSAKLAVAYEIKRQGDVLDDGNKVVQETRGWHDTNQRTFSQRKKEEAHDYRYFPEPDIPPFTFEPSAIEQIERGLPELPAQRRERFRAEYGLTDEEIGVFVDDKAMGEYYEAAVSELLAWAKAGESGRGTVPSEARGGLSPRGTHPDPERLKKLAANYLLSDLRGILLEKGASVTDLKITPEDFAELVKLVAEDKITSRVAKDVLQEMFSTGQDPSEIVEEKGLSQVVDEGELEGVANQVIADNTKAAADFKEGKEEALKFLIGKMMAITKGKANPKLAADLLRKAVGGA